MDSLLTLVLRLLSGDEELTAAYQADPEGFAQQYFGDLCAADWDDLRLALDQSGEVERDIVTGGNSVDAGDHGDHGAGPSGDHGRDSDHALTQLHSVVNNYTAIDDRDTITDQSTVQAINTGGGDFWQRIDNNSTTVSGDGAVVAGDDIDGPVNTGEINDSFDPELSSSDDDTLVVGDGNLVGDHNDDNIVGDQNVVGNDDVAIAGDDINDIDVDVTDVDIDDGPVPGPVFPGPVVRSDVDDSFNDDSFNRVDVDDSFNRVDVDDSFNNADDSFNTDDSFNDVDVDDSLNNSNIVNDESSNEQVGLINVNDVLSHNNIPLDLNLDLL